MKISQSADNMAYVFFINHGKLVDVSVGNSTRELAGFEHPFFLPELRLAPT
jgi:hypothetical protein